MARLTGWLVTVIGVMLVLALILPNVFFGAWFNWVIALVVLIIGISKLCRSYSRKKR